MKLEGESEGGRQVNKMEGEREEGGRQVNKMEGERKMKEEERKKQRIGRTV